MLYAVEFRAMGCQAHIQLETVADGSTILAGIPARVEAIEARLTRFRPTSELMQFNAKAGQWQSVSDVLYENIRTAKHAARLTDGLYNPLVLPALLANGYTQSFEKLATPTANTPPAVMDWQKIEIRTATHEVRIPAGSALDLGGIAKGWTARTIANELSLYGACLVNLGGDLVAQGAPSGHVGWPITIHDPFNSDSQLSFSLCDASIATSGIDYRRWQTADGQTRHHIIHPRTGQPAQTDVVAVSVLHPDAPTAEAYAKTVILRGAENGLEWLQGQWHAAGLLFRADGAIMATSRFTNRLQGRTPVS